MVLMILLMKEKDLGKGCASCRFLNMLKTKAECTVDERVCVYKDGEINIYRPYCCPFRYYDSKITPIVEQFHGMTKEETKGWFEGADYQARRYAELEDNRDRFVQSEAYKGLIEKTVK